MARLYNRAVRRKSPAGYHAAVATTVIASTPAQREDAFSVRIAVFVGEQGISRDDELDEHEGAAIHCVAYEGGAPVGAGRVVLIEGYAKIGRMAVLRDHRRNGIGADVLRALEREAAARGAGMARLSAQVSARGFYERNGYAATGDVYDEVGIPHIAMEKALG
jgi:predicted GNAT family N-acyltransferase